MQRTGNCPSTAQTLIPAPRQAHSQDHVLQMDLLPRNFWQPLAMNPRNADTTLTDLRQTQWTAGPGPGSDVGTPGGPARQNKNEAIHDHETAVSPPG
jgi:hypothetical protein